MRFTISGVGYQIDRESVIQFAQNSQPEPIDGRHKHFVVIDGRRYPIKQMLGGVTGLSKLGFNAQYAHRILRKLGFQVEEFGPSPPHAHFKSQQVSSQPLQKSTAPANLATGEIKSEHLSAINGGTHKFAVVLEHDEDGFVVASCPSLPGCLSQGRNRQEALRNIVEAIRGYTASMRKHDEQPPDIDWEVVEVPLL